MADAKQQLAAPESSEPTHGGNGPLRGIGAREYLFEFWYPLLRETTFESEVVALTRAEAHALVVARERARLASYCRMYPEAMREVDSASCPSEAEREVILSRKAAFAEKVRKAMACATSDYDAPVRVPDGARAALARLDARLAASIARVGGSRAGASAPGAVVKLTARSPKDALFERANSVATQRECWSYTRDEVTALGRLVRTQPAWPAPVEEIVARATLTRAAGKLMRVECAADALDLFTRSLRVYEDLTGQFELDLVECGIGAEAGIDWTDESAFPISLVVRRFEPRLDPLMEFRCFVTAGEIRGITQYDPYSILPRMFEPERAAAIEARLRAYLLARVCPAMAHAGVPDYTVDLGLAALSPGAPEPDGRADEPSAHEPGIWMIEINNPPPIAGAALFGQFIDGEPWPDWSLQTGPYQMRAFTRSRAESIGRIWTLFDCVPPDLARLYASWALGEPPARPIQAASWCALV